MGLFSKLFGPPRVKAEMLGVLDLTRGEASDIASADAALLGPLFGRVGVSLDRAPKCTWLLVYCTIDESGRLAGTDQSLGDIVRDSGAPFVVVATPNLGDAYKAAAPGPVTDHTNLIMTLDRQGDTFAPFLQRLIVEMKKGKSLAMAWVEIAPQVPGLEHPGPQVYAVLGLGGLGLE